MSLLNSFKLFLILNVLIYSLTSLAEEIPSELLVEQTKKEWNLIDVGVSEDLVTVIKADFDNTIRTDSGKYYLPWAMYNIKKKNWISSIEWMAFDCEEGPVTHIGGYRNGVFAIGTNQKYSKGAIGYYPKQMICGIQSDNGKVIYGWAANYQTGFQSGWAKEDLKLHENNKNLVEVTSYLYSLVNGRTGFADRYLVNCSENNISKLDSPSKLINPKEFTQVKSLIRNVCIASSDLNKQIQDVQSAIPSKDLQKNQEKITIDSAKLKCESIGFKPKTEKFGNCVLELMR